MDAPRAPPTAPIIESITRPITITDKPKSIIEAPGPPIFKNNIKIMAMVKINPAITLMDTPYSTALRISSPVVYPINTLTNNNPKYDPMLPKKNPNIRAAIKAKKEPKITSK